MSVATVTNRLLLATFRSILNTWRSAINTLITDLDTAEATIVTNTSAISTLQTSKQDANATSTLRDRYSMAAGDYTLVTGDKNKIIDVTNIAPSVVNFPDTAGISFNAGDKVIILNNNNSSDNLVLTGTGASSFLPTDYSTTLGPGESAYVIITAANRYKRIF